MTRLKSQYALQICFRQKSIFKQNFRNWFISSWLQYSFLLQWFQLEVFSLRAYDKTKQVCHQAHLLFFLWFSGFQRIQKIRQRHLFLVIKPRQSTHKIRIDLAIIFTEEFLQGDAECVAEVRQRFNSRITQSKLYFTQVALRNSRHIRKVCDV